MQSINPAFRVVNICCACDDNYAKPLSVCLYSLLKNADKKRLYDIVILHSNISSENTEKFRALEKHFPCCSIRFVDMMAFRENVKNAERSYITAETNYRLAIFGELFSRYDRMLYIDCDIIVEGDISELYDTDLKGNAVGAAKATDVIYQRMSKKGYFIDGKVQGLNDYIGKVLDMKEPDRYFNAGVLVLDLKKIRKFTSEREAVELLNSRKWLYNDQDVLNILFENRIYLFDIKWNYTINIELCSNHPNPVVAGTIKEFSRKNPAIIHYISGSKPWLKNDVPLWEHYNKYEKEFTEEILCQ